MDVLMLSIDTGISGHLPRSRYHQGILPRNVRPIPPVNTKLLHDYTSQRTAEER